MKLISIGIVFILLVSCKNIENNKNVKTTSIRSKDSLSNKLSKDSILLKKDVLIDEILNNEFANTPLGEFDFINYNLSTFFTGNCDLLKQTTVNKYTNEIDTLIVFKKRNSVVRFYKTREKVMLDSLDVSEQKFVRFNLGLDISMNKKEILNLFNVNSTSSFADTIAIVDEEATTSVKLIFIENKLKRIIVLPW